MPQRNSFHVITIGDRQFEVWAPNEKEATRCARFKEWAGSKSHVGLRRILRIAEPWPVLVEEANYITTLRGGSEEKRRAAKALLELAGAAHAASSERRLQHQSADEAAYARRAEEIRADNAARQQRRDALDRQLGRHRPIPNVPTYHSQTMEWV